MVSENEIIEELKRFNSPLAGIPRSMPFTVPSGYFEGLNHMLVAGVKASEIGDPLLDLPKEVPFAVPVDYFNESAERIAAVASIASPKAGNYAVPDGYFEGLPAKVMEAIRISEETTRNRTKTIAFAPGWLKPLKWAVAAMVILTIGLGSYKAYYTPDRKATHQLARVDREVIGQYVMQSIDILPEASAVNTTSTPRAVKELTNEEITRYLDETGWEDPTIAN